VATTPNRPVSKSFRFFAPVAAGLRVPIKPRMIDLRVEAENHWLRYGRFVPRSLRQLQLLRNPGIIPTVICSRLSGFFFAN
jgi:hypothetical protein